MATTFFGADCRPPVPPSPRGVRFMVPRCAARARDRTPARAHDLVTRLHNSCNVSENNFLKSSGQ